MPPSGTCRGTHVSSRRCRCPQACPPRVASNHDAHHNYLRPGSARTSIRVRGGRSAARSWRSCRTAGRLSVPAESQRIYLDLGDDVGAGPLVGHLVGVQAAVTVATRASWITVHRGVQIRQPTSPCDTVVLSGQCVPTVMPRFLYKVVGAWSSSVGTVRSRTWPPRGDLAAVRLEVGTAVAGSVIRVWPTVPRHHTASPPRHPP